MKKNPQIATDRQEKAKSRVPFFALQLKRETLCTIQGGEDLQKKAAQEADTKIG